MVYFNDFVAATDMQRDKMVRQMKATDGLADPFGSFLVQKQQISCEERKKFLVCSLETEFIDTTVFGCVQSVMLDFRPKFLGEEIEPVFFFYREVRGRT